MDLPATYYGKLDQKNPLLITFVREINLFLAVMKKVASQPTHEDNSGYVKGVKILMDIWKNYKHRLPPNLYQEHMLQVADFLFDFKFYDMALWYGYSLHLQQFTSVNILDIEDVDHFKACFFPKGLETDQDTLLMKIRALHGCALCIFEQVKAHPVLTPDGLYKLLCVLDLIRIIMQVFQHYDSLCWQIYNGSALIYNICQYLRTMDCGAQALEYLLWASFSIELSVPLMTSKYVPWLVTLYCAVCQCYYDNHAAVQGEVFARRALVKINELRNLEEHSGIPASRETIATYKEASIKLASMVFKRAVFEARSKMFRLKTKKKLTNISNAPWPRNVTEQILTSLFQGGAAQFWGVLEALKNRSRHPQQTGGSEDPEVQEVVLELLAAGISLLSVSENTCEHKTDHQSQGSFGALTTSSSLIDLAIAGESQVCHESTVEFIKLLYYNKQPEAFTEYSKAMLQLLSGLEGQSFRKAEQELGLLYQYSKVQKERPKTVLSLSDEFIELVKTLHKSVCESDSDLLPDRDLVLSVILLAWDTVASVIERAQQYNPASQRFEKWVWCLSKLCEVSFNFEPCTVYYCIMTAEMTLKLAKLFERVAKCAEQQHSPEVNNAEDDGVILSSLSLTKVLQKVCAVVKRGLNTLSKGMSIMLPRDGSAVTDSAYMQKYRPSSSSPCCFQEGDSEDNSTNVDTSKHTWTRDDLQLAVDLHLNLNSIYFRAMLGLLHLNTVPESELLGCIKKNKVSKAVFLMQKALMEYKMEPGPTSDIKNQLEEACELIRKAGLEERKLYMTTVSTNQSASEIKSRGIKNEKDCPPPPPVLISRSDSSLRFVPAPYHTKEQVCWYKLLGHVAEGTNLKVRLGDCSLQGTGCLIPAESGRCVLKVEGLDPNQKYVFAVAAYNSQGNLMGSSIGETTIPMLASPPLPLLTTWALLAQVAFQTNQYDVAKRACQKLWSHFTHSVPRGTAQHYQLVTPKLQVQTLWLSSIVLRQSVFASIFIETEINIQLGSLHCNPYSHSGLFIWEQIARLEECERMLVAIDIVSWLTDNSDAIQAFVVCYFLLSPLIYHQITCNPGIQVLTKCLKILEENLPQLKQKWTGSDSQSLMRMIACITYYLYKALHNFQEPKKASELMESGVRLIQEVFIAQKKLIDKPKGIKKADAPVKSEMKLSPQLKALLGKNKNNDNLRTMTFIEDHCKMYDIVLSTPIRHAFQEVMKLRQKTLFIETSTQLLQRALEEQEAALVIEWGQSFLDSMKKMTSQHKPKSVAPVNESQDDTRRKLRQGSVLKASTISGIHLEKILKCGKKQIHCEESVWRTNLNYTLAQAHLMLFYQGLAQLHAGPLLHRYSQLDPLNFSMAYSGVSLRIWRPLSSKSDNVLERNRKKHDEDISEEDGSLELIEQHLEMQRQTAASMLDSLNNCALYLRQAMVLAHRSDYWALLRRVVQTIWDQYCRTAGIVQRSLHLELPLFITAEQQQNIFSPLLVLATELIMDMLNQLGLWRAYGKDLTEEETQSFLYFSASLDGTTKMDMHWVKTLVIHTLEQLHDHGKWEKLAHLALHFNTYTQDRYTLIVSPLLINAQRKLLERIQSFRGPAVPQPHHVKTQQVTGHKVTYKSYAGIQLLTDWTLSGQEMPMHKKVAITKDCTKLKDAEVQRSMALVCVPLDVKDTLYWYRKALEKRSECLQFYQHSHSLLERLLANTHPYYVAQSKEPSRSASMVEFNPQLFTAPSVKPCDLIEESYCPPGALYSLPLSPEHIPTIIAAYSTSVNHFHGNRCDSLTVVALHEMGNLQYYNGNTKAAHSCWTKAINSALRSSDALEKWDGVTFGGCSLQERLKLSGLWGCLQAACLTAKIAQYILTTDISKRTNYCLQSAHLFKCVLCCSLAQPQSDLHYSSDIMIDELLPGVDLFSDPSRVHLGTVISSLSFICHWLFSTGYYVKLFPMLALYHHFVGPVCRDVQLTVECKILKIRALTELGFFTEAVREAVLLTKGVGIRLPHGHYINKDRDRPKNKFHYTKSILDNIGALEELVNCDFNPGDCTLYGPALCLRSNLARTQLILAICAVISCPLEVPDPEHRIVCKDSEQEDTDSKCMKSEKRLDLDSVKKQLSVGQMKFYLLEAVSTLLNSVTKQLTAYGHVGKVELTVESRLLKAKLDLMKGQAALSSEIAASSLILLESASGNTNASIPVSEKRPSHFQQTIMGSESKNQLSMDGNFLEIVETSERTGFSLWMRCRLSLVHSLTAHNPDNKPGIDIKTKAARIIRDGIEECKKWGDPDSQALLMLAGAQWDLKNTYKSKDDKSSLLKEIVSLLSGRLNMPPRSVITLAQATMLLSDMKTKESISLLRLSQTLLKNQLCCFTQNIVLDEGGLCLPCSSNICLPFLHLLHHTTLCIGQILGS